MHEIELNIIVLPKTQSQSQLLQKNLAKDEMRMLLSYTVCSLFLVRDVKAYIGMQGQRCQLKRTQLKKKSTILKLVWADGIRSVIEPYLNGAWNYWLLTREIVPPTLWQKKTGLARCFRCCVHGTRNGICQDALCSCSKTLAYRLNYSATFA